MKIVDFRTTGYFNGFIIFLGILLTLTGLLAIFTKPLAAVVILVVSVVIFTTHYRLKIDFNNKTYYDYLWILGMKHGDKGRFEQIEYIYIKSANVSQTMRLRAASTTIAKEVYDGYLKFSDGNRIHLMTEDSKSKLVGQLKAIAGQLNAKVIDYTQQV